MLQEALSFYKDINVDKSKIEKILSFNYYELETLTDLELSKYSIILSQYLVYFKWQFNQTKVDQMRLKHKMESTIFHLMSSDIVKAYKTKADARAYLVNNVPSLTAMNEELEAIDCELMLADGIDKPVQELVNVFKREQSRRENELTSARFERR